MESKNGFLKRIVEVIIFTFSIVILSVFGLYSLVGLAFPNMSVEQSDTWLIICLCIGIIFTIFFCTFLILDEIKRKN